jgi:hypothetical protein
MHHKKQGGAIRPVFFVAIGLNPNTKTPSADYLGEVHVPFVSYRPNDVKT